MKASRNDDCGGDRLARMVDGVAAVRGSMPQTPINGQNHRRDGDASGDHDQPQRRERIEHLTGHAGRHDKAGDHHHPDDRGRRRAALLVGPLGQQAPTATCRRRRPRRRSGKTRQPRAQCRTADASPSMRSRPTPAARRSPEPPCRRRSTAFAAHRDRNRGPMPGGTPEAHSESRPARPAGSRASPVRPPSPGSASRWSAPRSRRGRSEPDRAGRCRTRRATGLFMITPALIAASANALISMPTT